MKPPWDRQEDESHICSIPKCGRTAEDEGWPFLIYITVVTSPGEEGYAEVTQALCQRHYEQVAGALIRLGFGSHNHHGTNFLDDGVTCGGYATCPDPADYGPELVQPRENS